VTAADAVTYIASVVVVLLLVTFWLSSLMACDQTQKPHLCHTHAGGI